MPNTNSHQNYGQNKLRHVNSQDTVYLIITEHLRTIFRTRYFYDKNIAKKKSFGEVLNEKRRKNDLTINEKLIKHS